MDIMAIKYKIDQIRERYDPEHDLALGGPRVTATEMTLGELVDDLADLVGSLTRRVAELERQMENERKATRILFEERE